MLKGKRGEDLVKWKGSVATVALHAQTVSILHNLTVTWPPIVDSAFTPFELLTGKP